MSVSTCRKQAQRSACGPGLQNPVAVKTHSEPGAVGHVIRKRGTLLLSGFDSKPARWRAGSGTNRSASICVSSAMMHATPIRPVGQGEPRANSGGSGVECGGRVPVMRFIGEIHPSARFHPHRFSRPDIILDMIRFYQINQYVIP
jgi:hypothetical protein